MKEFFLAAALTAVSLTGCKHVTTISDFCRTVEVIGHDRLMGQFTDQELDAIKLDRKRAILALKRTYKMNCAGK